MLSRDDRRRGRALIRRCTRNDTADTGDLCRDHRHVRRRDHRIFTAGHVTADRVDRDVLVSEHHPRQGFHLDVLKRVFLDLREIAYLRLGELYVRYVLRIDLSKAGFDLAIGETEIIGFPAVELDRHFAYGGIAALRNVVERLFDDRADLFVRRRFLLAALPGFQSARHRTPSPSS